MSSLIPGQQSTREASRGAVVLDRAGRDADRVVLCQCGGFGRVEHIAVNAPGEPERYVRGTFTCTWHRPGPHEPLLPPRAC